MRSDGYWPTGPYASPAGPGKPLPHRSPPPEPTTRNPPLRTGLVGVLVGVTRRLQVAEHGMRWQEGQTVTRRMPSRATSRRAIRKRKNPRDGRCCRHIARVSRTEAPVGVEPTMADLQSAALATWLRSHVVNSFALRYGNLGGMVKFCPSRKPGRMLRDSRILRLCLAIGHGGPGPSILSVSRG